MSEIFQKGFLGNQRPKIKNKRKKERERERVREKERKKESQLKYQRFLFVCVFLCRIGSKMEEAGSNFES